jgi:hypothetical protein
VFTALLLALWLAAVQHCGLEAAGIFGGGGDAAETSCCDESRCLADACSAIEDAAYVHPDVLVALPPADAATVVEFVLRPAPALPATSPALAGAGACDSGRHRAHLVGWRFSQRSALPPGAPSHLS